MFSPHMLQVAMKLVACLSEPNLTEFLG